ncbi:NUDIX domain-containing protein [uncultured Actinomyces sp.]|uniref:NUDIX hydrolase n=1 Tax=uncultured Actinomyces sp. TaxID=249061 RepID=UPI0028E4DA88|nr:NUDIX domain-containing protein [uncultured Actinomyces sp.]
MPAPLFALVPAAYLLMLRQTPPTRPGGGRTEVLLQLRRNTGYMDGCWACAVAGHVEVGEPVTRTVVREAAEEAGIVLDPEDVRALTTVHRSNDVGGPLLEQRVDFFFTARRWTGEPVVGEPGKNAGVRWFALDAPPDPMPPHERVVLHLLAAHLAGGERVPAVTTFGFAPGETIAAYGAARPR